MLWNTLKAKVGQYIKAHPENIGAKKLINAAIEARKTIQDYLDMLPPESAVLLRDVIPEAFPKPLRKGKLIATQNIHKAWCVNIQEMAEV